MIRIGITPRFVAGNSFAEGSASVDRLAVVEANNQMITAHGALPLTVPLLRETEGVARAAFIQGIAENLDGLMLQGGTDVEPGRYGEHALRPEWCGDALRDRLEFDLVAAFLALDKPVLGVCRGFQLLNVAMGGSLHQDLPLQYPSAVAHNDELTYCGATHAIELTEHGVLSQLYGTRSGMVNSAHHQGIKALAGGLRAEAFAPDGLCEGFSAPNYRFVVAVQWHPEFHHSDPSLLRATPLIQAFLHACASSVPKK